MNSCPVSPSTEPVVPTRLAPGSIGVMYAIGSGPLDNAVATAAFAPLLPLSAEKLATQVTVGGQNAQPTAEQITGEGGGRGRVHVLGEVGPE